MSQKAPHVEGHFKGKAALKDIVIGMSDGLTVPFALAAGLSGANIANSVIITAGVAELVAGSISMGLGGYLAGVAEIEHYSAEHAREVREIEEIPHAEKNEVKSILKRFGISAKTQDQFVDELTKDKGHWIQFMMEFELGLQKPMANQVTWGALRIGLAYAIGGLVPLLGYYVTASPREGVIVSSLLTAFALCLFGFVKSQLLNQPRFKGMARMLLVGAMAAAISYVIAKSIT